MDFEYDEHYFILEDEFGAAEKLELSEFRNLLKNVFNKIKIINFFGKIQGNSTFIEILIICCRKGFNIANIFSQLPNLQIKHIIYFEFNKPEKEKNFINFLQDVCMNEFSIEFVTHICNRNTISESFKKAEDGMTQKIVSEFSYFLLSGSNFKELLGEGPKIFTTGKENMDEYFKFAEGNLKDISKILYTF